MTGNCACPEFCDQLSHDDPLCRECGKTLHSCPYCQAEQWGYSDNWAMGPEVWAMLKRIHDEQHKKQLEGN